MTALRCLAIPLIIIALPTIAMIGGWIADQLTAQKQLPTDRK